jgi:hypothetical protein
MLYPDNRQFWAHLEASTVQDSSNVPVCRAYIKERIGLAVRKELDSKAEILMERSL